jgi:hypothetical protein
MRTFVLISRVAHKELDRISNFPSVPYTRDFNMKAVQDLLYVLCGLSKTSNLMPVGDFIDGSRLQLPMIFISTNLCTPQHICAYPINAIGSNLYV